MTGSRGSCIKIEQGSGAEEAESGAFEFKEVIFVQDLREREREREGLTEKTSFSAKTGLWS